MEVKLNAAQTLIASWLGTPATKTPPRTYRSYEARPNKYRPHRGKRELERAKRRFAKAAA